MSKVKVLHKSFKLTPGKSKINLTFVVAIILGTSILLGGYFYSTMQRTSINEIRETRGGIPRPTPKPTPRVCETVATFSLSGSCGDNNYQTVSFTCSILKSIHKQGDKSACKSVSTWYDNALSICATTCPKPIPSPKPFESVSPTPTPTPRPTPITSSKPR
ncbi:MAG: hypothetical protein ACD_40C00267G0002 [uncultured bacterium]|nr:MAG: hypothetical protein ACD_40C00267G0002 [uncultured bacterium]